MKRTLILLFLIALAWGAQAQNPWFDLSYPWLYPGYVKDNKIQSIVLGTMDSDGATQLRQIVLYFDEEGNPVKEESRIGFKYSMTLVDEYEDMSVWVFNNESETDSVFFKEDKANHQVIKYLVSEDVAGSEGRTIFRSIYQYDEIGRIIQITDSEIMPYNSEVFDELEFIDLEPIDYDYDGLKVTSKSDDSYVEMVYNDKGQIQVWKTENYEYGINEEISYQWDYKEMLLMIDWTQEGASEKTFVTYTFYE